MSAKPVIASKEELIKYLEKLPVPEHKRAERDQLILQLKQAAPHFPIDKKLAKKEITEFLHGDKKKYNGLFSHLEIDPNKHLPIPPAPVKKSSKK